MTSNLMRTKSFASALVLAAVLASNPSFAQSSGVNSVGDNLPIGAGGTTEMTVLSSGMVGVGTTAPNATLDVSGGGEKIGYDSRACDGTAGAAKSGTIRFNTSTNIFEGCNGTNWQPLGGGSSFSVVSTVSPKANTRYQNTTGGALFLSSLCPNSPNFSGYRESVDYYIYDTNGNKVGDSHGQIAEGGSDGNFNAAPYASAIVPAGYSWSTEAVFYTTVSACSTSVAASIPYSL